MSQVAGALAVMVELEEFSIIQIRWSLHCELMSRSTNSETPDTWPQESLEVLFLFQWLGCWIGPKKVTSPCILLLRNSNFRIGLHYAVPVDSERFSNVSNVLNSAFPCSKEHCGCGDMSMNKHTDQQCPLVLTVQCCVWFCAHLCKCTAFHKMVNPAARVPAWVSNAMDW